MKEPRPAILVRRFFAPFVLLVLLLAACSDSPQASQDPDSDPEAPAGIVGQVINEGGDPVPGARVEAVPADAEPNTEGDVGAYVREAETADDGSFSIDIEHRGRYKLVVHAGGLGGASVEVEASGSGTIRVTLTVNPTGAIEGQVNLDGFTDSLGTEVFIPGTTFIARTDTSGAFRLDGVPAGDWTVVMEHDDFARAEVDATVSAGGTVTLPPVLLEPIEPIAITSFTADPTSGAAPLDVAFTWEANDPSGVEIECRLDVNGDGIAEHEGDCVIGSFTHTFEEVGSYRAELRVRAPRQTASAFVGITVSEERSEPEPEPSGFPFREYLGTTGPSGEAAFFYDRMDTTDEVAVIGSPGMSSATSTPTGGADYYVRTTDGEWAYGGNDFSRPPGTQHRRFGKDVVMSGSTVVISGERRNPDTAEYEAVLYSYEYLGGGWSDAQMLLAGEGLDLNRITTDAQDDLLAVGIMGPTSGTTGLDGPSVRLFERAGDGSWVEGTSVPWEQRDDNRGGAFFGADVDLSPNGLMMAVADTTQDDDGGIGTNVFLFERLSRSDSWTMVRRLVNSELPSPYSAMLEVQADTLIVAPIALRETRAADVYVFNRGEGGANAWGQGATLELEVATHERLIPYNVLLSAELVDDTYAVGIAPVDCHNMEPGDRCAGGRVYVFEAAEDAPNTWNETQVIEDEHDADSSRFGEFVGLSESGHTLVTGGTVNNHEYTFAEILWRD